MSVATQNRGLIDDANSLIKETYPLVKNPKLFISAVSDCKMAMSNLLIELFQKSGITFDSIPEEFEKHLANHPLKNDTRFIEGIKNYDYASSIMKSFSNREVDFFKNEAYYIIEENNKLTRISIDDVMIIVRSAMSLYELWYEEWKNH